MAVPGHFRKADLLKPTFKWRSHGAIGSNVPPDDQWQRVGQSSAAGGRSADFFAVDKQSHSLSVIHTGHVRPRSCPQAESFWSCCHPVAAPNMNVELRPAVAGEDAILTAFGFGHHANSIGKAVRPHPAFKGHRSIRKGEGCTRHPSVSRFGTGLQHLIGVGLRQVTQVNIQGEGMEGFWEEGAAKPPAAQLAS